MRTRYKTRLKQSGNILFLILLAVVLFAALSYAVTSSMRGGGNDSSDETAELAASQITQYGALVKAAIDRLRLTNNCRDTQISFQRDWNNDGVISNNASDAYNSSSPSDKSCHVFDAAGGAVPYQAASSTMLDPDLASTGPASYGHWETFGLAQIIGIGTDCTSSDCADLILVLRSLKSSVCQKINDGNGITGLPTSGITNLGSTLTQFTGTYNYINTGSVLSSSFSNKAEGCLNRNNAILGNYSYYKVLIAR